MAITVHLANYLRPFAGERGEMSGPDSVGDRMLMVCALFLSRASLFAPLSSNLEEDILI